MAMDNKRNLESQAHRILRGDLAIKECGPREYRPEVPDVLKGVLLRGAGNVWTNFMARRETKEDAVRKHKLAVQLGYLSADVQVKYNDDGTYTPKK